MKHAIAESMTVVMEDYKKAKFYVCKNSNVTVVSTDQ